MNNWYKIAKLRYYEGDKVSVKFGDNIYRGVINYGEEDGSEEIYWIKFDDFDRLSGELESEYNLEKQNLLDWMEDGILGLRIRLIEKGPRWEDIDSELDIMGLENFGYMGSSWDVREAKRIIHQRSREVIIFNVNSVKYYIESGAIYTDSKKFDKVDLTIPLILITTGDKESDKFPIDGWHRIRKAIEEGIETLPAYLLTKEETKIIRD